MLYTYTLNYIYLYILRKLVDLKNIRTHVRAHARVYVCQLLLLEILLLIIHIFFFVWAHILCCSAQAAANTRSEYLEFFLLSIHKRYVWSVKRYHDWNIKNNKLTFISNNIDHFLETFSQARFKIQSIKYLPMMSAISKINQLLI